MYFMMMLLFRLRILFALSQGTAWAKQPGYSEPETPDGACNLPSFAHQTLNPSYLPGLGRLFSAESKAPEEFNRTWQDLTLPLGEPVPLELFDAFSDELELDSCFQLQSSTPFLLFDLENWCDFAALLPKHLQSRSPEWFASLAHWLAVPLTIAEAVKLHFDRESLQALTRPLRIHQIGASVFFEAHRLNCSMRVLGQLLHPAQLELTMVSSDYDGARYISIPHAIHGRTVNLENVAVSFYFGRYEQFMGADTGATSTAVQGPHGPAKGPARNADLALAFHIDCDEHGFKMLRALGSIPLVAAGFAFAEYWAYHDVETCWGAPRRSYLVEFAQENKFASPVYVDFDNSKLGVLLYLVGIRSSSAKSRSEEL